MKTTLGSPFATLALLALTEILAHAQEAGPGPKNERLPRLDPAVVQAGERILAAIREEKRHLQEPNTLLTVRVRDGLVFAWDLQIEENVDFEVLAVAAGVAVNLKPSEILAAWTESVRAKAHKMTIDAIASAGTDPHFNPETDFEFTAHGTFGIATGHVGPEGKGLKPNSFSISFTGSRREELRDEDGAVVRPGSGELRGGAIRVELTADKIRWKSGECITGRATIRNVGKTRVRLELPSWPNVGARTPEGVEAILDSGWGYYHQVVGLPDFVFLEAGQERSGEFFVGTNPRNSWEKNLMKPGTWLLQPRDVSRLNLKCECEPVTIEVAEDAGK